MVMKTELNVTAILVTFGEMARYGRLRPYTETVTVDLGIYKCSK
jgi:hypothetical protein